MEVYFVFIFEREISVVCVCNHFKAIATYQDKRDELLHTMTDRLVSINSFANTRLMITVEFVSRIAVISLDLTYAIPIKVFTS